MLRDAITTIRQAITTVIEHHQHRVKLPNLPKAMKQSHALNLHGQVKALIQLAMWVPEEGLIRLRPVAGRTTTAANELTEPRQ